MCIEWSTVWSAVGAIATAVGATAIIFASNQLRFDAWLKAQEIWNTQDFIDKRSRVYSRIDTAATQWSEPEEAEALDVCRKMDEFAGLIPFLPKRTAMTIWGAPFAKAWLILEPKVREERRKCHMPDKWRAFEKLGKASLNKHPEIRNITPQAN